LALERADRVGGAVICAQAFLRVHARVLGDRYLVSVMPRRVIADLGLGLTLACRRYSPSTPVRVGPACGLLIDKSDQVGIAVAFAALTGGATVPVGGPHGHRQS
jgi:hypothetical protein